MILILTLLQIFQKFWYWYWIPPIFFKNVDIDFDCFLPISTILILILIFSRDFKILDLDIEAKKPFLPISGMQHWKIRRSSDKVWMVEKMSQSYATQPYQKLLNEPPLDKSGPQPKTHLIASLWIWILSKMPGISSGGLFQSYWLGCARGTLQY